MRSRTTLAVRLVALFASVVALGFASIALAQSAPSDASPPAASPVSDRVEAAESPRRARERRRARETAAAPAAEAAAQPNAEKAAAESELVCKTIRPAGTRLPQRVCYTQEEWDSLTDQSQEDMRRFRDRATASGARPQ
jgi:hypothetical protein